MDPAHALFDRLDHWRSLPSYQLERRVDALFGLYLPAVLALALDTAVDPRVVPELPLLRDTLRPAVADRQGSRNTVHVDFFVMSQDRRRGWLVELKTDLGSRRPTQDADLATARALGLAPLLEGLLTVVRAPGRPAHEDRKYGHLLRELATLGLVTVPPAYDRLLHAPRRQGLTAAKRLLAVCPAAAAVELELVYIQPEATPTPGAHCIDFARFAAVVARHGDTLSQRFAQSLDRWRTPPAPPHRSAGCD